jgi:hypothetical protein
VLVTHNEPAPPAARPPAPDGPETARDVPGPTGDPQVDAALDKLADLAGRPLNEHPAVFEQIHGALTGALGTLDSSTGDQGSGDVGPGGPGSGR